LDQAERYVTINGVAQEIAAQFLPGALTLVLPLKTNAGVPSLLVAGASTLGIRIPNHPVCEALSQALDFPVTTTSANRSGQPNTYLVESVEQQLAMDFDKIDLAIDVGALPGGVSTVIGIEGESIKLIREGTIPFATISQLIDHTRRKV